MSVLRRCQTETKPALSQAASKLGLAPNTPAMMSVNSTSATANCAAAPTTISFQIYHGSVTLKIPVNIRGRHCWFDWTHVVWTALRDPRVPSYITDHTHPNAQAMAIFGHFRAGSVYWVHLH